MKKFSLRRLRIRLISHETFLISLRLAISTRNFQLLFFQYEKLINKNVHETKNITWQFIDYIEWWQKFFIYRILTNSNDKINIAHSNDWKNLTIAKHLNDFENHNNELLFSKIRRNFLHIKINEIIILSTILNIACRKTNETSWFSIIFKAFSHAYKLNLRHTFQSFELKQSFYISNFRNDLWSNTHLIKIFESFKQIIERYFEKAFIQFVTSILLIKIFESFKQIEKKLFQASIFSIENEHFLN